MGESNLSLKPITAKELRNLSDVTEAEKEKIYNEKYLSRIINVAYKGVIAQAENNLNKRKWFILSPGYDFNVTEYDNFLKKHYKTVINKLKQYFPDCKITYDDMPSARGLYLLKIDWS